MHWVWFQDLACNELEQTRKVFKCLWSALVLQTNGVRGFSGTAELTDKSPIPSEKQPSPVCRFVNVKLYGVELAQGAKGNQATVLLEIPQGQYLLNLDQLTREVTKNLTLLKHRCCYLGRHQFAFVVYFALFEENKHACGAEALGLRFSFLLSFMNVARFSLCEQISGSLEQLSIICYCWFLFFRNKFLSS